MSTGLKDAGRVSAWSRLLPCVRQVGAECASSNPTLGLCPRAYRVKVGALVLGAVAGVAEGLLAARVLAQVWLLARVAPQVDLEVLQPREGLAAALKLQERLVRGALQPPEGPPPSLEVGPSILSPPTP